MAVVTAYPNGEEKTFVGITTLRIYEGSESKNIHLSKDGTATVLEHCIECRFSGEYLDVYF